MIKYRSTWHIYKPTSRFLIQTSGLYTAGYTCCINRAPFHKHTIVTFRLVFIVSASAVGNGV